MIVAGIIIFIVGALVMALLGDPEAKRLGRIVAAIGIVVLVIGLILALLDGGEADVGALLPALGLLRLGRARFVD